MCRSLRTPTVGERARPTDCRLHRLNKRKVREQFLFFIGRGFILGQFFDRASTRTLTGMKGGRKILFYGGKVYTV